MIRYEYELKYENSYGEIGNKKMFAETRNKAIDLWLRSAHSKKTHLVSCKLHKVHLE